MKRTLILLCAAAGVAACAPAGGGGNAMPKMNDPADLAAVGQVRSDWQAAFNAGDSAKLASLYTADARSMSDQEPTHIGGAAAASANMAMRAMVTTASIALAPEQTEVVGDMAYDQGTFKVSMTPKTGAAMTQEGRYLVVLRRQADSTWKLVADMGNTPTPPAPPPGKK
jgi:uncharacterized protein (TIGR02246 family)